MAALNWGDENTDAGASPAPLTWSDEDLTKEPLPNFVPGSLPAGTEWRPAPENVRDEETYGPDTTEERRKHLLTLMAGQPGWGGGYQYEDYPTIAEMPLDAPTVSQKTRLMFGLPFADTAEGKEKIIHENMPDVTFGNDKYGNRLVTSNGQTYHINRPDGLNAQTISDVVPRAVVGGAAAAAAGGIGALSGAGLLANMGLQGVAGATSYLGQKGLANTAGAQEQYDLPEALTQTAFGMAGPLVGKGVSTFYKMMDPTIFEQLPRGAQSYFIKSAKDLSSSPTVKEMFSKADPSYDMMLDDPNMFEVAKNVVKTNSPGSDIVQNAINSRQAALPTRIASDINSALGPLTADQLSVKAAIDQAHSQLSPQKLAALQSVQSVSPSSTVAVIDNELQTAKGPVKSALQRVRNMLVLDEGSPGTQPIRATTPTPGGVYTVTPGKPATPPTYETNPVALENARQAIDKMIKYGDDTAGIPRGSLSPQDRPIYVARDELSKTLKNNVPGYNSIMSQHSNLFDLSDAHDAGLSIFKTGPDALRPSQVLAMSLDPNTGTAFRLGVRSAVDNKLKSTPNDIAALRKMSADPYDFIHENLSTIYGNNAVESLQNTAQREMQYAERAKQINASRQSGISEGIGKTEKEFNAPVIPSKISEAGEKYFGKAVAVPNAIASGFQGTIGPSANIGRGQFLTSSGPEAASYSRGLNRAVEMNKLNVPLMTTMGAIGSQFAKGGRTRRASGGKVTSGDVKHLVDRLMTLANHAKKDTDNHTKPLLDAPDESIVKALRVANEAI